MSLGKMSGDVKALASMGFVVGLVLIMLAQFLSIGTSTTASNTAINSFISGIGGVANWVGIIVLALVGAYLLKSTFGTKGD